MKINDLVDEFERLGIQLWSDDGQLRYRAPQGVLTDERKQILIQNKADLLAYLGAGAARLVPHPDSRFEPFPLTQMQSAYQLGQQQAFDFGGVACTAYMELVYPGDVSAEVEQAWNDLVARHDMLRAVVDDGSQRVLPAVETYRVTVERLPGTGSTLPRARLDAVRERMQAVARDGTAWPLFDVRATVTDESTVVHLLVELVVVDAASVQILLGELDAALSGDPLPPPPTVTFRDYVVAERTLRTGPGFHRDRAYWTSRLEQLPPAPELPVLIDAPDGPARFRRLSRRLEAHVWEGLRRRSEEHQVTSSTTVLTAFAETLGRWARRREFTVNVPVFNRLPLHEQIGAVVGDFTSVSLLGVSLDSAGESFAERAGAIGGQLYADLDHRLFSGLDVITELTRRRKHPPLFPVVFTSTLGSAPGAASSRGRFHDGLTQTPQVWIDCQVMADADGGLLSWDVREGVLPDGLPEAAFEAFADLVGRLATSPDPWDERYPVRLPESQRRCRAQVNETAAPLPQHTLHGPVLDRAVEAPHRPAVVDSVVSVTYGELVARAEAVARRLGEAGCQPGDRVAVSMVKGADQVVALLGAHLAGTVYVPVDPGQPTARRDKVLAGAGARAVMVQSWNGTGDTLPEHLARIEVDRVAASPQRLTPVEVSPDDPAYVIYTSGSTGEPKGVEVTHRAAANTIDDVNTRFGVDGDDTVLSIVNLGFDLSVYDVFGVLAVGGTVVLPAPDRRADPSHWADLVRQHQVTVWNTVPSQMQMLQDYVDSTRADGLGSLRLVLLSGDWIPLDLPGRVRANHPAAQVVSLGGATEAAIWSIWHPVDEVRPGWRSIPYGKPLQNQSFRVLDGTWCDRPDWVPGELYIGGAGLASRYVGDPHKTQERFVTVDGERLYRTGDLARYWPDGTIEFLGREDDQVKIRGHRVELGEIEAALRDDPVVADAAVVADGERTERRLTGFVELAQAPTTRAGQGDAPTGGPEAVQAAASAACSTLAATLDTEAAQAFVRHIDALAVQSMVTQLRSDGLFADPEQRHTEHEVAQAVRVDGRRRRLLRRWLDALEAADVLAFDPTDRRYHLTGDGLDGQVSWDAETVGRGASYGAGMVDFLRACTSRLGALLRGEADVRDLLFPEGGFGAARAVYEDNHVVRSLNSIVAAAVREIAEQHGARHPGRPLRLVEIGAGAGGATAAVVEAVGDLAPDYLFTDVSGFFLTEARRAFAAHPWMRLGVLDINDDLWSQGYAPNSADLVLCANSLHNAHDVGQALAQIRNLVAPGGWLVLVEPVRRHSYSQLVSTEFELGDEDFVDERASTGQAFFARDQWLDLLTASGATDVHCVPEESSLLDYGQAVVLARFKAGTVFTTCDQVQENLAGRVPDYMIPPTLHLVDALPRSANGKLDRATLVAWAGRDGQGEPETSETSTITDELETRVAQVWEDILGTAVTTNDQDFYSLGGDSLLLSRMVGRLRERLPEAARWEWAVLLRRMLHDPTVRGLAHHLRTSPAPETSVPKDGSCVVDLGSAAGADAPVRVLVNGGPGIPQPFQAVIPLLRASSDYRLLSVETTDVDRYLSLPAEVLIPELAGEYARALAEHGDRFAVAGYCLGGFVAAEVARALTEVGATVDRLTIISSYQPPAVEDDLLAEYLFTLLMRADTQALGLPDDDAFGRAMHDILERTPGRVPPDSLVSLDGEHDAVGAAFRAIGQLPRTDRLAAVRRAVGDAGNAGNLPFDSFVRSFDVFCHSTLAVARHRPEPYVGPVSLLRNSGSSTLLPGTRSDVAEFWGKICLGELVVDDLPGDHFTCMATTNAALIATLMQGPSA